MAPGPDPARPGALPGVPAAQAEGLADGPPPTSDALRRSDRRGHRRRPRRQRLRLVQAGHRRPRAVHRPRVRSGDPQPVRPHAGDSQRRLGDDLFWEPWGGRGPGRYPSGLGDLAGTAQPPGLGGRPGPARLPDLSPDLRAPGAVQLVPDVGGPDTGPRTPAHSGIRRPRRLTVQMMTSTFSIVALDRATGEVGVAVASKVLAVGAVVPWARAGVGGVATQAWTNIGHGSEGLRLLAEGLSADDVLKRLVESDEHRERRQVGVLDTQGRSAAWTGRKCSPWAGHRSGDGYTCQGNLLVGASVVDAMAQTFEATAGALPERLLAVLEAGQAQGG